MEEDDEETQRDYGYTEKVLAQRIESVITSLTDFNLGVSVTYIYVDKYWGVQYITVLRYTQ